ncbi:MAG TPA: carboxypeptidase-like regulatory domain-containing protein [Thermoanaerobaculia bacterium]|nr:carboxypeptidase-like regulatory domain-containing protein [Thermoanaerobaculia bacterium]
MIPPTPSPPAPPEPRRAACPAAGPRYAAVLAVALLAAGLVSARQLPEPDNVGTDGTGTITDRDNTRVQGIAYDPEGNPLADVQIWVANHDAPAERQRTRTRKTGTYLARNLGPLFTEFNVQGVSLRLTFEKDGHQTVEATVGVRKNELGTLHPILWPQGVGPEMDGVCVVLTGRVTDARGKPARNATVKVASAEDPALALETTTAKDGSYELLLWNVPRQVRLEVNAPGEAPFTQPIALSEPTRLDLVQVATFDVPLGG